MGFAPIGVAARWWAMPALVVAFSGCIEITVVLPTSQIAGHGIHPRKLRRRSGSE
jgi:hypothetical protein